MKKKANKSKYMEFDESKEYLIPMTPEGEKDKSEDKAVTVKCNIKNTGDGFVRATADGYQPSLFIDIYFNFLLFTGYIKEIV